MDRKEITVYRSIVERRNKEQINEYRLDEIDKDFVPFPGDVNEQYDIFVEP